MRLTGLLSRLNKFSRFSSSNLAMSTSTTQGDNNPYSVVYITTPNEQVANTLAGKLVEAQLAACVNIIPGVTSVYVWQGKVERDQEHLLLVKTQSRLVPELAKLAAANHPYDCPEVISIRIDQGHQPYLNWIGENTKNE